MPRSSAFLKKAKVRVYVKWYECLPYSSPMNGKIFWSQLSQPSWSSSYHAQYEHPNGGKANSGVLFSTALVGAGKVTHSLASTIWMFHYKPSILGYPHGLENPIYG